MRLLLDEMWPPAAAEHLRTRGHDVHAVAERPDLRGQPDGTVFATAQTERSAIVTENVVDYRPLAAAALRAGGTHCGVIFRRNRSYPRSDARTIGRLVAAVDALLASELDLGGREHWLS